MLAGIPFHIQTNTHTVIDMKMLLDPAQAHEWDLLMHHSVFFVC